MTDPRTLSLWHETVPTDWTPRSPLRGDRAVDVAVVGAGFTGLWTAYHLAVADPDLRIAVLEEEVAGFGASGRNGGWCSALFPASLSSLAALPGSSRAAALAQHAAMVETLDHIEETVRSEGIECDFARGGTLTLARSGAQEERAHAELAELAAWGLEDTRWLDRDRAAARLGATRLRGALFTPHCAAIHPGRLVRGLSEAAVGRGVDLHEATRVTRLAPHRVETDRGTVTAEVVVRATEGYTPRLPGHERAVIPVYSLIIATEPLPAQTWEQIGLRQRETFSDQRHLIIYGQRTADDRLVFGGRGAPYHFGSRIEARFDRDPRVFSQLRATLVDLFPVLETARFSHAWGGTLAIPRDWCASVGLDRETGLAWAGGYVGDGVSTTNLAGRTLRDLVLGRDTDLTRLPWVGHHSPDWEPEPLRWLGINAGLRLMAAADQEERLTGRPSRIARVMAPLLG